MKPVAYKYSWATAMTAGGPMGWVSRWDSTPPPGWAWVSGQAKDVQPMYSREQMAVVRDQLEQERCRNYELSREGRRLSERVGYLGSKLERMQASGKKECFCIELGLTVEELTKKLEHAQEALALERELKVKARDQRDRLAKEMTELFGNYALTLKPFVALMAKELAANSHKGDRPGWLGMCEGTAMAEIEHHTGKLYRARTPEEHKEHAADVANCAMMLLDVMGQLVE